MGGLSSIRSFEVVTKFYQEAQLHAWVSEQNLDKGITPGTRATLEQQTVFKLESSDEPVASQHKKTTVKSAYQWLRRWRRRWCVKYDKLRAREWLSGDEKQLKVGMGPNQLIVGNGTTFFVSPDWFFPVPCEKRVPPGGTQKWPPLCF